MNYAIYRRTDGSILMHGYCISLEQVWDHESEGVGIVEVDCDVTAETHLILDGVPVLKVLPSEH